MAGAWYYASGLQIATIYPAHNDPARLTEDGHLGTNCYRSVESHGRTRSEEHTSELQSHLNLVCRLLLEKKKNANHRAAVENESHTIESCRANMRRLTFID